MQIAFFYHSLVSDWNHGNAHFLRGVTTELLERGHDVEVFEPREGWSLSNLIDEQGREPIEGFHQAYPQLESTFYEADTLDLDDVLDGVDLVVVHEWNSRELIRRISEHRRRNDYRLLFHDTHHRCVTDAETIESYDLSAFDGVLAFGEVIKDLFLEKGWTDRAWTWHEAADTRIFRPIESERTEGDVVWIGNWGDEERSEALHEYLVEPVRVLGLDARVYGVRYPEEARKTLDQAGIEYAGWLPNYRVPEVFSRFKVTLHLPRRPYVEQLPGIPTIRPFEALACGIPLICSPWEDRENLFTRGEDYVVARDGDAMKEQLRRLLSSPDTREALARHGRRTILGRHTCAHRVDRLMDICGELDIDTARAVATVSTSNQRKFID